MNFPFLYQSYSVRKIMFFVLIACIPGICAKCYFFGPIVLIQILFTIIISLFFEIIILKLRGINIKKSFYDNSIVVTAVLFSLSLPVFLPFWIICIGVFFSVVIAKHLYGGIGHNIFNPAMIGYIILLICFPLYMSNWSAMYISDSLINTLKQSFNIFFSYHNIFDHLFINEVKILPDFFTQATPLDIFKNNIHVHYDHFVNNNNNVFLSKNFNVNNSWTWINISFLLGGLFLLYKNIICWYIPFTFLFTLIFLSSVTSYFFTNLFASPIVHLFSGGTMMCAFFIATDPVTTACTIRGRILFSFIIGVLVWIIRTYSDYPDAIAFSVLFANMLVPLIDYLIKTTGYGHNN